VVCAAEALQLIQKARINKFVNFFSMRLPFINNL